MSRVSSVLLALRSRLGLIVVLVIGTAFRIPGMADRAPWLDEAYSIRYAQLDWGQVIAHAARDNHPPLSFIVLKLWMATFGSSLFAMRMLDVIFGVATIWVAYALALRIFAKRDERPPVVAAAIAAGWIAVHPTHILWSSEIRMYALSGLLAVTSALLLVRALERPMAWSRWAVWALVATVLLYTHYYGAFVVLAQGVHALVVAVRSPDRRAVLLRVVVSGVAIVAACVPWSAVVMAQTKGVAAHWWVPPLDSSRLFWEWARIPGLLIEDEYSRPYRWHVFMIGALAIAIGVIVVIAAVQRERGTRLVAWCTLFPLGAGLAMTLLLGNNVILARYLIVSDVFLPLAVVGFIGARTSREVAGMLLVPVAFVVISACFDQVGGLMGRPDIPAAADWIERLHQPGDVVVVENFYYETYRIRTPNLLAPPGLLKFWSGAKLPRPSGTEDVTLGPNALPNLHGRIFIVDSPAARITVPASFERIGHHQFETWMPPDRSHWIDATLYRAP